MGDQRGRPKDSAIVTDKLNPEAMEYFRRQGARGGRIGAKRRMEKLTKEQRSDIARNAVAVRERKRAERNGKLKPKRKTKAEVTQ